MPKYFAQMPQFSQFYAIPMYLNPALAGNTAQDRFAIDYRIQWPSIPGAFKTFYFSYDHNFTSANSGLGLMVLHDKAGSGGLTYTNLGGLYSYDIAFSRRIRTRFGIKASFNQRVLDILKLTFTDQLLRGGNVVSTEGISSLNVKYFDMAIGGMVYSYDFWAGVSLDHFNTANESLKNEFSAVPLKGALQFGKNFSVQKNAKRKDVKKITTALNYKFQSKYDQLDFGAYYTQFPLVAGVWYRGLPLLKAYEPGYSNNDAITFILGIDMHDFRVGYSYDMTISKLVTSTSGSHEISMVYEFASPNKKRKTPSRRFVVPCAKF